MPEQKKRSTRYRVSQTAGREKCLPIPVSELVIPCRYFAAGECQSCALLEKPYDRQLSEKQQQCFATLPSIPQELWLPAAKGPVSSFRNKAKLAVGGRRGKVTLGILDSDFRGVDLRDCPIHAPEIMRAIPVLVEFLNSTGLPPYAVTSREGELKYVHVTVGDAGALLIRFVVRSAKSLRVLQRSVNELRSNLPSAQTVSVNLLPAHKALIEGEEEHILFGGTLPMTVAPGLRLHLRPQSFFQTNTHIAKQLYAQVAEWVAGMQPQRVLDLYCGVGGFALTIAQRLQASGCTGVQITGVEIATAAIRSASRSCTELNEGVVDARIQAPGNSSAPGMQFKWVAADATAYALGLEGNNAPDTVIVNPPRRGISPELCAWLQNTTAIQNLVYSSCNPVTLARDLAALPDFKPQAARLFDMFPHTGHMEVAVLLHRCAAAKQDSCAVQAASSQSA